MKRSFKFLLVVSVLLLFFDIQLFAQDPIDQYPGIPLVIYPARRTIEMIPQNFTQMSEMGIYGVVAPDAINIDDAHYLQQYKDAILQVIPQQIWWAPNDIYKYTDAYYTVWEAEGTDPNKGLTTLYYDQTYTSYFNEGNTKGRKTVNSSIPSGTQLIFGPGYPQVAEYKSDVFNTIISYTAEFKMKIVSKTAPPSGNPVVCTLKITNLNENLVETDIITPVEVRLNDFGGWNNWKSIPVQYDLTNVTLPNIDEALAGQPTAFCVQFKIIWNGLSFLNLYMDNIKVHDQNGLTIVTDTTVQNTLKELINDYKVAEPSIIGWYAIDEPGSIDNYEPYRVVDSIINSVSNGSLRLHTGFTGGRRGKFSSWLDIDIMALGKFQDQEFWLRAKPKNLQLNLYNYHYPYKPWSSYPSYNENWKELNIDYVTNTYLDRINDLDTNFTFSTQTGGYYNYDTTCQFIDTFLVVPSKYQINYHVNLGLLYGAKELRLDPMFSSGCGYDTSKPKIVGLINLAEDTTANYNFFRYTLIPRLNGSFGKELKRIHQKVQHPKLQLPRTQPVNSNYNWLTSITYLTGDGSSGTDFIDVGFFETHYNSGEVPYFMVVNRWYNTAAPGNLLKISIDKTGSGYTNWNVSNFIENTKQTIVNSGYITMPHIPGEARLFKVYPVVKDGGQLLANETVLGGTTLTGDMSIESGATLYLVGNYNANANITVKSGGKIICTANGKITFGLGKQLFLEGNAQLLGSSSVDNLKLQFNIYGDGVVIKPGSNVLINNCEISGAYQGIANQIGDQSAVNISNTKINAVYCGVSLSGGTGAELQSTPTIQNCNITSTTSGIAVSNYAEFLIQNNKLNNCGIIVSNIPASYIQGNNINGGASQSILGVFMNNSSGYIRKDTITNCLNAIQLANSSPILAVV